MAIKIPIVTEFNGTGMKKAVAAFKQLDGAAAKAKFAMKAMAVTGAAAIAALGVTAFQAGQKLAEFARMAADDEKGQKQLALSIRASTKATDAQIAAVEDWIDTTQRAVGVADDELRPAFGRLVRSTNDISKAQDILKVALDVSAATGKPLKVVTEALGKAYDGNVKALQRLGLGFSKADLQTTTYVRVQKKAKDGTDNLEKAQYKAVNTARSFDSVMGELEKRFGGSALENAQTFEGVMDRFSITMDELKESLGKAVLPYLKKLAEYGIQIADAFGKDGVAGAFAELKFILKGLLYDENGQLNQAGRTLNDLASKANKLASVFNFAQNVASATPAGRVANAIGGRFGFDPSPTMGSITTLPQFALTQRNPENAQIQINVYGVVGDKAAVGEAVTQSIRAWERRSGGRR